MMPGKPLCHCGKPLHYNSPTIERIMVDMVKRYGTHVRVTRRGQTYFVPRHYIALHGIRGADLDKLGFTTEAGS